MKNCPVCGNDIHVQILKLKDIPVDESVGGEILEFRTSKTRDYTLMDPTQAYPQKELKKWRRHIILEKPLITIVVDEVTAEKGSEIEARFRSLTTESQRLLFPITV